MLDQPVITQSALPLFPWAEPRTARLPGVNPLAWEDWIIVDDAFEAQMAHRAHLLNTVRDRVLIESVSEAGAEMLTLLLAHLAKRPDYDVGQTHVHRPDGQRVDLGRTGPLETAAALVQQDLCIMEKRGDEHVLTAAILCFPANWKLAEKIGRPMTAIHAPVAHYDDMLARRVQRMFDAMQPDRPLWRMNHLLYRDAPLYQPERHSPTTKATGRYIRCERQSLVKLPRTGAIVFGIHTYVVPIESLTSAEQAEFFAHAKEPYKD